MSYAEIDGYVNLHLLTATYSSQEIGIELSMTEFFDNPNRVLTDKIERNRLSIRVVGLDPYTEYYYRTFVKVNELTYYGEKRNFTTKGFFNIVAVKDVYDLTFTSATMSFDVDAVSYDDFDEISCGVAYSTVKSQLESEEYINDKINRFNSTIQHGLITISIKYSQQEEIITKLQPGTTYYYRPFTRVGNSYKVGDIKSFSTIPIPFFTLVCTGEASEILNSVTIINQTTLNDYYPRHRPHYGICYATKRETIDKVSSLSGCISDGKGRYFDPETNEYFYIDEPYTIKYATNVDDNSFIVQIEDLSIETTYYYCAFAIVDGLIITGKLKSLTITSDNLWNSPPEVVPRCVLIEYHTGQKCPNCPDATSHIHDLQAVYPNRLVPVAIQSEYMGIIVIPIPTPIDIRLKAVQNQDDATKADIDVKVVCCTPDASFAGKLQVWITEDGIVGKQDYTGGVHYDDYVHNHVLRAAVNGTWGDDVSVSGFADAKEFHYTVDLAAAWKPENLAVVAFVYNTYGVEQATRRKIKIE